MIITITIIIMIIMIAMSSAIIDISMMIIIGSCRPTRLGAIRPVLLELELGY